MLSKSPSDTDIYLEGMSFRSAKVKHSVRQINRHSSRKRAD